MATTRLKASIVTLLCILACVSVTGLKTPGLGFGAYPTHIVKRSLHEGESPVSSNTEILYYTQTLDHFNYRPESYTTFPQKYIINSTYWAGANASAPIFVTLGAESGIGSRITDNGIPARFNALMVAIEHRYYGESMPFGSSEEAFKNSSTLGYFTSAQALADYAEVILHIKKTLSAENCPVIVMGCSYGGMLATWFRLKYPHIAVGAVASSAPILYFDDLTPQDGYFDIVTKAFMDTSWSCYNTIQRSWSRIDEIAARRNGLSTLSKIFKTCEPLNSTLQLKDFLDVVYAASAQYNRGPQFIVSKICDAIDGAPPGTSILGRVLAGVEAYMGDEPCHDTRMFDAPVKEDAWGWQTCTELVMPIGITLNSTMFHYTPFNLTDYTEKCRKKFGVVPRLHWVTTEYGGHDLKQVLAKFGSNIIFSNGLRDPYSSGGVLQNISDNIVAINTEDGSHCVDIGPPFPTDPKWLVKQRASAMKIMGKWIADYNNIHGI